MKLHSGTTPPKLELEGAYAVASKGYFDYQVYGLRLASEIKFPELAAANSSRLQATEITLRVIDFPEHLKSVGLAPGGIQIDANRVQVKYSDSFSYLVINGREIWVDSQAITGPNAIDPAELRAHLLGSALGIILHQRGALPLHVSALSTPSGVWAFTGLSGAGKSTLAAWLNRSRGWPLLTDDVGALFPDDPEPALRLGPPRAKLWKDALDRLGIDSLGLMKDILRDDKFHLTLEQPLGGSSQGPVRALVQLARSSPNSEPTIERLAGASAFRAVMGAVYRPQIGKLIRGSGVIASEVASLASRLEVYKFRRPWSLAQIEVGIKPLIDQIHDFPQTREG